MAGAAALFRLRSALVSPGALRGSRSYQHYPYLAKKDPSIGKPRHFTKEQIKAQEHNNVRMGTFLGGIAITICILCIVPFFLLC